jgi:DNA polymerase-1
MNYIVCKDKTPFETIGDYNYCTLEEMVLSDTIACDSETNGLQPRNSDMFCFQIGTGKDNYIIVMYNNNYEFSDIIPYIKNKTLIFHNALFDLGFCYKYGFYPKNVRDTMLASKIIYNGGVDENYLPIRHDFGSVMKKELNVIYDKTEQKNIHIVKLSQPSTIEYSFNDVDRLIELHDVLLYKIENGGFKETYDLHCRYINALAYMEQCGLPISSKAWKEKMEEDIKMTAQAKQIVEEYIYDNIPKFADRQIDMFDNTKKILISINSPIQMLKVFKELGIKTKDKDGKDSIGENIISKSKHEFVKMWLNFQEANHRVTTFGNNVYKQIEYERIYTNFNPMVDTARLSTRKGNINFLNFPSDSVTRKCFKANEGNVMIVCDYEAQEGIILTDKSKDEAMMTSVIDGADLHCLLTKAVFPELKHLSDDEIKKNHKDKRNICKVVRFLFSYGGNSYTLHMNEGFPLKQAVDIEESFKELHKGVYEWGDKVFQEAIKAGFIESSDGWKLALPKFSKFKELKEKVESITKDQWTMYKQGKIEYKKKLEKVEKNENYTYLFPKSVTFYKSKKNEVSQFFKLKSEYQRLSLNSPIQSCGAHMIKRATLLLFDWIIEKNYINKVLICNSVHDELVVECIEELSEETKIAVENCMKEGGNYYLKDFKIGASANINSSWGLAK